jgi:hypothetical protein
MELSGKSSKKEIINGEESNLQFDEDLKLKETSIEELKELN